MLYIGSDHAGFDTKEHIKIRLLKIGIPFVDVGAYSPDDSKDYPDIAKKVSEEVSRSGTNRGILICGSGTGMVIAANRFPKVRAAMVYDRYSAEMSRKDNDSNVIALRGRDFGSKKAADLVEIWLDTKFSGESRHRRRIRKLAGLR